MSKPTHIHYAPMFRDLAGRAITFPLMQGEANDALQPLKLGAHVAGEPRMGLTLIGLASFPCDGDPMPWSPDGSHPALGFYVILAGGVEVPEVELSGRC